MRLSAPSGTGWLRNYLRRSPPRIRPSGSGIESGVGVLRFAASQEYK
jgi:hypothetical protein